MGAPGLDSCPTTPTTTFTVVPALNIHCDKPPNRDPQEPHLGFISFGESLGDCLNHLSRTQSTPRQVPSWWEGASCGKSTPDKGKRKAAQFGQDLAPPPPQRHIQKAPVMRQAARKFDAALSLNSNANGSLPEEGQPKLFLSDRIHPPGKCSKAQGYSKWARAAALRGALFLIA